MKRIIFAIIAIAAACTPLPQDQETPSDSPENPSVDPPQNPPAAQFDPKGSVKTVTKEVWQKGLTVDKYMHTKLVTTITYDGQGRPKQEAIVEYTYDEKGQLLSDGFGELKRNRYFFFDGSKMEIRQHPEAEAVIFRANLASNGCITHYENGYMQGDKWKVSSSYDCSYSSGPYLKSVSGSSTADGQSWSYSWNKDGNMTEALQQWKTRPEDPSDDETKYYIYGNTHNVTLGCAYDVLGLLIDGLDPYGLMGKCPASVPEYANSTYRNQVLEYDFSFSREGPYSKVTVVYRPFADEGAGWAYTERTYVYSFTYYE